MLWNNASASSKIRARQAAAARSVTAWSMIPSARLIAASAPTVLAFRSSNMAWASSPVS
jgi:hypothetical protein